jgi:hypothetical protein
MLNVKTLSAYFFRFAESENTFNISRLDFSLSPPHQGARPEFVFQHAFHVTQHMTTHGDGVAVVMHSFLGISTSTPLTLRVTFDPSSASSKN